MTVTTPIPCIVHFQVSDERAKNLEMQIQQKETAVRKAELESQTAMKMAEMAERKAELQRQTVIRRDETIRQIQEQLEEIYDDDEPFVEPAVVAWF